MNKINGSADTKSVKKVFAAVILASRAQKYVVSFKELQDFFYEQSGILVKMKNISSLISEHYLPALTVEYYIERELSKLGLDKGTEVSVRKNLVIKKRSNPIIDAQDCIVQSLRKLGLMALKSNRHSGIHWHEFDNQPALRWRINR